MNLLPQHERRTADWSVVYPLSLGNGKHTIAVKDSIDVAGVPTRHGSALFADAAPAERNAEVVNCLLSSGDWRIIGKSAMHELAFGVTGVNSWCGTPVNPASPDRIPGGSSSGSAAAVACGLSDAAIGSDTGGSVRMPAACCGVIGLKPTFGLVNRRGAHPAETSLDCIGPFARTVAMIERVMKAIAPGFAPVAAPDAIRVGTISLTCDVEVAVAFESAITRSGAEIITVALPSFVAAFEAGLVIIGAENWAAFGTLVDEPGMGEDVRARIRAGGQLSQSAISHAEVVRRAFTQEVDAALAQVDVLALPTLPIVPPTLAEAVDAQACVPLTRFVRPFNLSGHPAITLPLRTVRGLPAGLQLVGRRGGDAALCAVARALESRLCKGEVA